MAKRTKEEAHETRELLLNAAEALFIEQGVSKTSLQKIAQNAGLTRGAIYWHFKDKVDLLQAILDRAVLPSDDILYRIAADKHTPPSERILALVSTMIKLVTEDQQVQRAIDIITHKVELVGEFAIMNERYLHHHNKMLKALKQLIHEEFELRKIAVNDHEAENIARAIHAITDGLFHSWLHDPNRFNLHEIAITTTKAYLCGLLAQTKCS